MAKCSADVEFVRKNHNTFDKYVAPSVAPALGMAARCQVLIARDLSFAAAALRRDGTMFVSRAPVGVNEILQFCYFILLVQWFIRR